MRTITVRRIISAPIEAVFDWLVEANNYRSIPGVFHVAVHPAEGAEPNGVGAIREFTSAALKVTEEITAYQRPHHMNYLIQSSIPPLKHDGGSMTFQETPDGTEVTWTTSIQLEAPVLADIATRLYAPCLALGTRMMFRAADRALTRSTHTHR
jgi:uncharacterized protein YndB with AHSA1/START domain